MLLINFDLREILFDRKDHKKRSVGIWQVNQIKRNSRNKHRTRGTEKVNGMR